MRKATEGKYDYGVDEAGGRGVSINVEVNRHQLTITYSTSPDYTLTSLQTLTRDINDLRQIYKNANDSVENALQEVINQNKKRFPGLFDK